MLKVKFFPNSKNNLRCGQACMQMILDYYYPKKSFSKKKLNELLKIKNKKMYSFPEMQVAVLSKLDIDSKYYTTADDDRYYKKGKEYLLNIYPKNVAEKIWKMSNFNLSKPFFKKAQKEGRYIHKKLSFKEIEDFFEKKYLVSPVINLKTLENKKGYVGHSILITDINKEFITFHDPGLPPIENNKIKRKDFIKSWKSSGTSNTVVIVFGKK